LKREKRQGKEVSGKNRHCILDKNRRGKVIKVAVKYGR
jgi:hypothetical protein